MSDAAETVRNALAKMTPGEWGVWVEPCAHPTSAIQELIQQVEHTDPFIGALYLLDAGGKCPAITGCGPTSADNAAGIVALKNHTPALLAELDAARAALRKAAETFQHYGDLHAAKPDPVKAQRNYDLAAEMRAALEPRT